MHPRRRRQGSIRGRITAAMITLAALALATSGALVAFIQHGNTISSATARLEYVGGELTRFASEGDQVTGAPFTNPSDLLYAFLRRTVPFPGEGELGYVGSSVRWEAAEDVTLRIEDDPELLGFASQYVTGDERVIDTVTTEQRTYRVLVVPVIYGEQRGALVHAIDLSEDAAQLWHTMTLYFAVAFVIMAVVVFIAWLSVGRLLRPVKELRDTADSIHDQDLTSRVPVRGDDELSKLAATINRMLDRVQRSVEGQQRLLDDVGHELRTPITVVRGHLELIDPEDPEDVAQTRDLVIDEVDRMGVLINDLLMLAKATQDDFVKPEWYDLATLTDQVLEKARALGDRSWRLERVAEGDAFIDPGRVTQAWLQLAANAVKYSAPGSPITLGSRIVVDPVAAPWDDRQRRNPAEPGVAPKRLLVELWVRDQGIGIAPGELDKVRERFGRGERAAGLTQGAGLGLSIVDSIATAHGGQLRIESEEGVGSTFTLVLPMDNQEGDEEA